MSENETQFCAGMLVWCRDPGVDPWLNFRTPASPLLVTGVGTQGTPDERDEVLWLEHKGERRGPYLSRNFKPSAVPLVVGRQYVVDGRERTLTGFNVAWDDSCTAVLDGGEERALLDLTPLSTSSSEETLEQ